MKRLHGFIILFLLIFSFGTLGAQVAPRVSMITAEPGPEVYELYGHQAVRVRTPDGKDLIYNFGLFDYSQPNFIYRFVKGETDYMGGRAYTPYFLEGYEERGSRVIEQELNLTPQEADKFVALLEEAVRPENATYRYKYCTDNCSIRILELMEEALESAPQYADAAPELTTCRQVMRRFDGHYPWYAAGVDVALGSDIDKPIGPREKMFVPLLLQKSIASTRLADGRPLVKSENILVEGRGDMTLPPTPLPLTPLFWAWILLLCNILVIYDAMRRGWSRWRWWASLWFFLTGLSGCLSWFLIFVSVHEATSPNIIGWWLNPLWIVPAVTLWMPGVRRFTKACLVFLSILTGSMLTAWCFGARNSEPALMIFCVIVLSLAVSCALTGDSTLRHHNRHKRRGA